MSDNQLSTNYKTAYFAGGCFWGVEYYMQKIQGVITVESGYMGGNTSEPTYQDVCRNNTGHLEVVKVTYDPEKTDYQTIAKTFFEIHDPTQANGQGPDLGEQYLSAIFYSDDDQRSIAEELIKVLEGKGYKVATSIRPASIFWKAEDYHQNYYNNKGTTPYCHGYTKRF